MGQIQHVCSDAVLRRVNIINSRHYAFPRALNITVSCLIARHSDLNRVIIDSERFSNGARCTV